MKNLFCAVALLLLSLSALAQSYQLLSPDSSIKVVFQIDAGQPTYSISVDGQPFMLPSKMGFAQKGKADLAQDFNVQSVKYEEVDSVWTQLWGENKHVRENYRALIAQLKNRDGVRLQLTFRAFNDGVGFRYSYDLPQNDSVLLMDELTEFNLAQNGVSWSIPGVFDSYEFLYRKMPLSELYNANTPMTFKLQNGMYGSIHEAALTDFPEMVLYKQRETGFKAELAPWPDGVRARFAGSHFESPWRTILIGRQAVDLINSSLILNLNEPCAITGDLSWIRPMKYVGVWWGMHLGVQSWTMDERHGATTANAKKYIDFAAAHNIQAVLFEGWNEGWETWGNGESFDFTKPYADFNLSEILQYANAKGVSLITHHETGGNVPDYERQLDKTYQWLDSLDVHCVKTGYAGSIPGGYSHHGQYNVRHYRKVVQMAANHQCMLDVHEPIKPTGVRRTYPNMMTREGVRGMEWNAWSEGNPPSHHEILPFTRMLAGPLDYTPGTFDILFKCSKNNPDYQRWNGNDQGNGRVHTTLCKQLANWVILYSPLQMASDMIENYENHPAFQFFSDYNADCDWSKALQGEIGEYVVLVRKSGTTFFLGATTNEKPRRINVPLNFLDDNALYTATIYRDALEADWQFNPTAYEIVTRQNLTNQDALEIVLSQGGGQAVVLKKQ